MNRKSSNRKRSTASSGGASTAPAAVPSETWIVHWDHRAVEEFNNGYTDKTVRKGVLTVVDFLHKLGPKLVEPHSKALTGEKKLRELRPGGGKILVRPLYIRFAEREFVILTVGPESMVDASGFKQATKRAKAREGRLGHRRLGKTLPCR